jgi:hypothetical protein
MMSMEDNDVNQGADLEHNKDIIKEKKKKRIIKGISIVLAVGAGSTIIYLLYKNQNLKKIIALKDLIIDQKEEVIENLTTNNKALYAQYKEVISDGLRNRSSVSGMRMRELRNA